MTDTTLIPSEQGENKDLVGYKHPPKEHQFKPGQSGNPNGRIPNKKVVSEWIRQILAETPENQVENMTRGELLARAILFRAMQGDMRAAEIALDRGEGKVTLSIEAAITETILTIREDR